MAKKLTPWGMLASQQSDGNGDILESLMNPNANLNASVASAQQPSFNPDFDPATLSAAQKQPPTPDQAPPQPQGPPSPQQSAPRMSAAAQAVNGVNQRAGAAKSKAEEAMYQLLQQPDSETESMKAQLAKIAGEDVHDFKHLDLSPILAMWAPQMAKAYQAPESPEQHQQKILDLTGKVAGKENDRYKDQLTALAGIDKANKEMMPISAMMADRQDNSMHARNISDLKKDPLLNGYAKQYGNISNALTQVQETPLVVNGQKMITKPQFDELQQAVRANLGIKGQSGVGERESTYLKPLEMEMAALESRWANNPKGIPITDPNVQHILSLANTEQTNVQKLADQRVQSRSGGFKHIYETHPDLANDLEDFKSGLMNQFKKSNAPQGQGGGQDFAAMAKAEIARRKAAQ